MNEEKPKKKRYQSQSYYVIKIIAGGYIGYEGINLLLMGIRDEDVNKPVCFIFGGLFAAFALWLLITNVRDYIKYTKTNRFEDEIYGLNSEDANLDPDAEAVHEEPEPESPKSIGDIARLAGTGEEGEEESGKE